MHPLFDPVTLVNLFLCIVIVIISIIGYVKIRSTTPLFIGAAFFLFGVSHVATLLGLSSALEPEMIIIRALGYILVCVGVYLIIREIMLRMKNEKELKTERLGLERRVDERTAEIQRTNEALQANRRQLTDIIDFLPDATLAIDKEGRVIIWNRAIEEMTGVSAAEMIGHSDFAYTIPFHREARPLLMDLVFADHEEVAARHPKITRAGDTLMAEVFCNALYNNKGAWVLAKASPLHDQSGNIVGAIESIRDITERKQAEEALRKRNAFVESVLENAPIGFAVNTIDDGQRVFVSRNFEKIYGVPEGSVQSVADYFQKVYFDPAFREKMRERILGDMATGDAARMRWEDIPITTESGECKVVTAINIPLLEQNLMISTVQDVTERKRAEEALREERQRLAGIIKGTNAGTWEWNVQTGETVFNDRWAEIIGYTLDEISPVSIETWMKFAHPDDLMTSDELLEKHFHGELDYYEFESRMKHKDGNWIWVLDRGKVTSWTEEGKPLMMMGTHQDITERKQLEERIRQVRTDLLFAVSHDLKSPLQALHQSQEMLSSLQPGEGLVRFQEYSEIWRRNLKRLERMINNLMDSQRAEEGRFPLLLAPCDAVEMVKRVVEDSQGYALSSMVSFDLKLQHVPEGVFDEEALSRVVENLLTNAVKFSQGGGRVEVRLGMEENVLLLEVQDHGLGIPANEQAQLFQPFQRGSSAHEKRIPGTGLGLYVCRRIVEEHGGSISLASEEGKGTIVTVRLPWGGIIGT
jgi:PAS domain S-box-containing protein